MIKNTKRQRACNVRMLPSAASSSSNDSESLRNVNTVNLVDPASSHMLASRTKPCKCRVNVLTVDLRTAHYNSCNLPAFVAVTSDQVDNFLVNPKLIHGRQF